MTIREAEPTASRPPPDLVKQVEEAGLLMYGHFALGSVPAARYWWRKLGTLLRYEERRHSGPRPVTHAGTTQTRRDWARKLGLSASALSYRLKTMPAEVALVPAEVRARVDRVWEICRFGRLLLALAAVDGNQRKAADKLGISAQRVSQIVNEYGMRGWVEGLRAAA